MKSRPTQPPAGTAGLVHTRLNPVFVIGNARSGTTLTCRLLRDNFGINFGTESQFILRHSGRAASYGDLGDRANLRRLVAEIARERFFARTRANFGFVLDQDRLVADLGDRTYAGVLRGIFEQFTEHQRLQRWGDKTPEYSRDLPTLNRLFPDALFLHTVRDGRDVALSMFKTGFGAKNAHCVAEDWRRTVRAITEFASSLPADRYMQVRYEDLVTAPVDTLTRMAVFLGIEGPDDSLATLITPRVLAHVRQTNGPRWRTDMSLDERQRFEAVAADELAALGYPVLGRRPPFPGTPERLFWHAHSRCRQLLKGGYWTDTLYRVGLRARAATSHDVECRPSKSRF